MSSGANVTRGQSQSESWEDYEKRLAVQVLTEVANTRRQRGLTVKDLASRLSKIGWPISVSSLNGMLDKRKSISIGELMAFARALEVHPIELLFPELNDEVVTLPGDTLHPLAAREAFSGDRSLTIELANRLKEVSESFQEALAVVQALEERRQEREQSLRAFLHDASEAEESIRDRIQEMAIQLTEESSAKARQSNAQT